jgi:hypothetical protein
MEMRIDAYPFPYGTVQYHLGMGFETNGSPFPYGDYHMEMEIDTSPYGNG